MCFQSRNLSDYSVKSVTKSEVEKFNLSNQRIDFV